MKHRVVLLLAVAVGCAGFGPTTQCATDADETEGEYAFAFSLVDIEVKGTEEAFQEKCIKRGAIPDYLCFYPITIPALAAQNLTQYAWMPWSALTEHCLEHKAPHGFFVYKVGNEGEANEGRHVFKKIVAVSPDSPEATLKFAPAGGVLDFAEDASIAKWLSPEVEEKLATKATFDDVMLSKFKDHLTLSMKRAIACTESALSFTTSQPFCNYQRFAWAADALQITPGSCGSYLYEKIGGGIIYHGC